MNINLAIYAGIAVLLVFLCFQNSNLKRINEDLENEKLNLIRANENLNLVINELENDHQVALDVLAGANKQKEVITKVITKEKIITKQKEGNESIPAVIFDTSNFILDRLRTSDLPNQSNKTQNTK
ncbi:Uncharacterised protein [Campylobacter hyointestinalis subsp. hyointestinalis]|uniref:Uncharacterized protein n=1 Tax=Campylobacter hyointestinalis subsp. hyointestinalis TaxID=91352 RepID=A0A0S4RA85_CAMHY|nr:hypothetical protein [Campylobacter hyointestinalis]PPB63092.1 hypothetical protein CDQ72_01460 [Campylobacter hyointestinalis subsp. hyointestinalis]PPB65362.1 hypothetical protein CDQ73_01210 [Campylobacter hyointestinalis subsp. hyointestinalis]CUU71056.1 Uncharacterised protein [Campylobacter hyointestinalis subsp. hyointestinalis]CUU72269.1 Uncharacterised protein [Campylobacter hyointestinalis subsp. hyointestinalis]